MSNQEIEYTFPEEVRKLILSSCETFFANFVVSGTVNVKNLTHVTVYDSLLDDFNNLTSTQKTIIKTWEKMKVALMFNLTLEKLLGTGNFTPKTPGDIPDSFFTP